MKLLEDPRARHDEALDVIERRFIEAANTTYAPLVRDARLALMQARLEARAAQRAADDTRAALEALASRRGRA